MATPNSKFSSVRTHFKTPEGRYKLWHEKTNPLDRIHHNYSKARIPIPVEAWQVTLAHLKDKLTQTSSSIGEVQGARLSFARLLPGIRGLVFGGGNGFGGKLGGGDKTTKAPNGGLGLNNNGPLASSYDGEGTYILYNFADTIFVSNYNSQEKDPIKCLQFDALPIAHTFDPDTKDGHDLLVGLTTGDVYSASLRQQLQWSGKKMIGATRYDKDGSIGPKSFDFEYDSRRCTTMEWVPQHEGQFVSSHCNGNLYIYDKNKDGCNGNVPFPPVKDKALFSVAHARSNKSNLIARWHICASSINHIAFSPNGMYLAIVSGDGYLRVFDYAKELLVCGCKSYCGSLLCCAWSPDGNYVLTGGVDDLVQVWSMEDQRVVAWGEGHNSWVMAVAFDPYWTASPSDSDETRESVTYRFGSVGQDTQLLLWDLAMDEVVVPLRRLGATLPASQSSRWEGAQYVGTLHPAPVHEEVPKLAPVMARQVHAEPLHGLVFTKDAILTASNEGHVKIWHRPGAQGDSATSNLEYAEANSKKKLPAKIGLYQ